MPSDWVTVREPDPDGSRVSMSVEGGDLIVGLAADWTTLTPAQWERVKAEGDRLLGTAEDAAPESGEDCGCGLGAARCRAAEDGDFGDY